MALAPIYRSAEFIGAPYQPSLNAALADMESYFGFPAVVKAPVGGARTAAQCDSLGTSWRISDHWEGRPARAVDIDNQRRFRNINEAAFEWILAMHGWHNIQTNSRPFPTEPWHFANHDPQPQQAGSGLAAIPETPPLPTPRPKDNAVTDFIYYAETASTDGAIAKDAMYYQECIGAPLFPFTGHKAYQSNVAMEMQYKAFLDQKDPSGSFSNYTAARMPFSGDNIQKLISLVGLTNRPIGNFVASAGGAPTGGDPALLAAVQALVAKTPTAVEIATEFIRQQKLEGN